MVVVAEASGLNQEVGATLMRSLLSEGHLRYEVVDKTSDGLKGRLIEREGPTGLVVTTTRTRLDAELETRLLSIPLDDSPTQTSAIMMMAANDDLPDVDLEPWLSLQWWLAIGEHEVSIPYAENLGHLIEPVALRLRRDFPTLLQLIRAHALAHRANRDRDAKGRIVASLDDYVVVRELVVDIIGEAAQSTVSPTIRETVAAVDELLTAGDGDHVTVDRVARHLGLDNNTAWRRVRAALDPPGYLVNSEPRGRRIKLTLGAPLPEGDDNLLPTPSDLAMFAPISEGVNTQTHSSQRD
jgi:hypothetical protein